MSAPDEIPPLTISVESAAARFSPGNWRGDTGRGGSVYRQSWNNGAWFSFTWNAAAHDPTAVILLAASATSCMVSLFLNGVLYDAIPAGDNIVLSGVLPGRTNTVRGYLRNSWQTGRWDGAHVVRVLGLQLDPGSTPGVAPPVRPWVLLIGDSITEGIQAGGGQDSFLCSYSFWLERGLDQLGYDIGVSACGYSGWLRPGDSEGDVPAYYALSAGHYDDAASRWNKISAGISLLDDARRISAHGAQDTAPSLILINYMTNDAICGCNLADLQTSVTQAITALRAAAPAARIGIVVPFGLRCAAVYPHGAAYADVLRAAAADDHDLVLLDFGETVAQTVSHGMYANPGGVHPSALGHALMGALLTASCALLLVDRSKKALLF